MDAVASRTPCPHECIISTGCRLALDRAVIDDNIVHGGYSSTSSLQSREYVASHTTLHTSRAAGS